MINFKRDSDNLIVAGNGPSLKNIDLNSLPDNFDVFRCNQFYCEDKYYLGKKIKLAMFNPSVIYSQLQTVYHLEKNNEYEIDYICIAIPNLLQTNFNLNKLMQKHPHVIILDNLLNKDKRVLKHINNTREYEAKTITSGVQLIAIGAILGYKNIYFTGIDFYKDSKQNNSYCYNIPNDSNMKKLIYKNNTIVTSAHSANSDLRAIQYLQSLYNIQQLHTLEKNNTGGGLDLQAPIQKQNNFTKDIFISSDDIPEIKEDHILKIIERNLRHSIKKMLGIKKYQNVYTKTKQ